MPFPLMPQGDSINGGTVKVQIDLEVTDELAQAVGKLNGGRGLAGHYEIKSWAQEALGVAADDLIQSTRIQEEESA
jgi:hypothetical protein